MHETALIDDETKRLSPWEQNLVWYHTYIKTIYILHQKYIVCVWLRALHVTRNISNI